MPTDTLRATVYRLAGAVPVADRDLLARFVADRDPDAFAALVRRHGPMVFGVCRRVIGDHHRAEDAFQAVFVTLARRAGAIDPPGAVGNWLYGAAYRTALEARTAARRRAAREQVVANPPELACTDPEPTGDLRAVLDEELAAIPSKYRALIVACDLEGQPRRAVAAAFGLCDGTLSSRLTTARSLLAARLRKRGVIESVVLALVAARAEGATVPQGVLDSAARIGSAGVPGVVPGTAALTTWVVRAMTSKRIIFVLLGAALVAGAWIFAPAVAGPTPAPTAPAPVPVPATREPVLLVWRTGHPALFRTDGQLLRELPNDDLAGKVGSATLSPDAKLMAYSVAVEVVRANPQEPGVYRERVFVRDLDAAGRGEELGFDGRLLLWSRDGRRLYTVNQDWDKIRKGQGWDDELTWVYDRVTKTNTRVDTAKGMVFADESPDGTRLLFREVFIDSDKQPQCRTYLTALDGTKRELLLDSDSQYHGMQFSPDGKKILLACHRVKKFSPVVEHQLAVYDVATKAVTVLKIEGLPKYHMIRSYRWLPDGKQIVFSWHEMVDPALLPPGLLPGIPAPGQAPAGAIAPQPARPAQPAPAPAQLPAKPFPWNLSVVNADGTNMKVIRTDEKHRFDRIDIR